MTKNLSEIHGGSACSAAEPEAPQAFLTGVCLPDEARALALGAAPRARWLSPAEEKAYLRLRTDKRRLDWLAGRVAAKRALGRYFRETRGRELEPAALEIAADALGAPLCQAPDAPLFSITHCAAGGLCAVGLGGRRVGADWEMVAPRSRELAMLFASPEELPAGCVDDPHRQTRLWALKEAVLKLLRLGLTAAPRDVEAGAQVRLHGRARERWVELGSPPIAHAVAERAESVVVVAYAGGPQPTGD